MNRIEALREKFKENGIDGMIVTSQYNRRYLTHFSGTAGIAVISEKEAVFITDFRYVEQANEQANDFDIVQHKGPIYNEVAKQIESLHLKHVGFEQAHLTYEAFQIYEKAIESAKLVPISGLVEELRMIKDANEIQLLGEAAEIADAAFKHITEYIRPGLTELDVANELEFFMRKQGAISSSFDTIVASGYRSALPHGVASEKKLKTGELVTLDYGAYYQGYCSDITRTLAIGEIDGQLRTIYDTVLEAQLRGMRGIKAGMTGKEADSLTRDYITEKGFGENFGHSTGHGLGMEVHEGPGLSAKSETVLKPGMVVTVEPGIYVSGLGGTRIEDDILITAEGNRSFTKSPKELIVVGV